MSQVGSDSATTAELPDVIWLAGVSWDGIAGTDRHMATAMSAHARLLWVDPPVSPLTTRGRQYGARRSLRPRLTEAADGITRLTPVALPGLSRPGIRSTTPPLIRAQVAWAARRRGIKPAAVVMSYFGDLLGGWGKNVVNVMYGTDDYVAGAELMRVSAAHIRARERRALASADVVVAITPQLAARWADLGVVPTVLPNGCWPVEDSRTAPASAAAGLPLPVVGLIGQLSERIDIDVLESIVAAGLSLLMVGPHDPRWEQHRFERLVKRPGVRYVGTVPVSEVRSYLGAIDVGITPYRDTAFNRASFPLKTLEYLGAGVPVVSADLPAARWLLADLSAHSQDRDSGQVLRLASSPAGFVDAIRDVSSPEGNATGASTDAACSRWKVDLRDRCTEFAETHSWPRRAEALAAAIGLPHGTPSREMAADGPGPRQPGQMRTR